MKIPQNPEVVVLEEESKTLLQEKLEILEKEWSSIKQQLTNPNPKKPNRRSVILECSPRGLMSSLQHETDDDVADDHDDEDIVIRRFGVGIRGRRLQFEEEGPPPPPEDDGVASEVCSSGSCLDLVINESVGFCDKKERSMSMRIARVCIFVALVACVVGRVRIRFSSFGFGEEEMVLVPT